MRTPHDVSFSSVPSMLSSDQSLSSLIFTGLGGTSLVLRPTLPMDSRTATQSVCQQSASPGALALDV